MSANGSPLVLAIVGHTNTGKTSLLRTLTRDAHFGEIADAPGTTRHVEGVRLFSGGRATVELFDTPGIEDAVALLDYIGTLPAEGERLDGPERIARFLDTPQARGRFEQEAKVLRQMLESDAALYVIDARDPVLAKHRDELETLADCGKPLLPVLNFTALAGAHPQDWRSALARLGLHAVVDFDTVAPESGGERRLFEALATLLDTYRPQLQQLVQYRTQEASARHRMARRLIADLLISLAAMRKTIVTPGPETMPRAVDELRQDVRDAEQSCTDALLQLYRFTPEDVRRAELPLSEGRWKNDLFHPETLKDMGVHVGSGIAGGAAVGAGIDLMAGGLTLGTAAALGALAGGLWQTAHRYGSRLLGKMRGYRELTVDDAILRLVALRQTHLLKALEGRGHAAFQPVLLDAQETADETSRWRKAPLPETLERARARPQWHAGQEGDEKREAAIRALAEEL